MNQPTAAADDLTSSTLSPVTLNLFPPNSPCPKLRTFCHCVSFEELGGRVFVLVSMETRAVHRVPGKHCCVETPWAAGGGNSMWAACAAGVHASAHINTHICAHTLMHTHVHKHTRIYTHTYTHRHAHIHIYSGRCSGSAYLSTQSSREP